VEQKKDFSLKRHQVTYHGELDMCESLKNILQKSIDNGRYMFVTDSKPELLKTLLFNMLHDHAYCSILSFFV